MDITSQNFELHIEELVLDGFDNPSASPGQGLNSADVRAAVQRELTRLFSEKGVPPSLSRGRHVMHLDGGTFDVTPDGPGAIGNQVAQALYGGFNR